MRDFAQGALYVIKGIRPLFTHGLRRFVILPIMFNFLLFSGLFYFFHHYVFSYADSYFNQLPAWLNFLHSIFLVIFLISNFLLFLSMFTVLFNVFAAPFNGLLAEKAQHLFFGSSIPSLSFGTIVVRSIKRQGQFLAYYVPRFIAMCLLFFVPFIHPIYPFLWFIFNAWMLSMQYQDFVMDNNLIDFKTMQDKLSNHKMLMLGMGSMISLLSFIPVLNILIMPTAVIGGVIAYHQEIEKNGRLIKS